VHVVVAGTAYHFNALNKASLLDLIELKKQTGLSTGDLEKLVGKLEDAKDDPEFSFIDDEGNLIALAVMIWLARRRAGERSLKFEDSADVPLDEIAFVAEDSDDEDDAESPDPS
jgi:hypothetical protein